MAMMMMTSTLSMQMDGIKYDSYAMRRAPQQSSIHMTQQMTTKVAPAYDGRTNFLDFEDAIDDWCDITELEPEKRGPALRNKLEGEAQQYKRLYIRSRNAQGSRRRSQLLQKILSTPISSKVHRTCSYTVSCSS